MMVSWTYLTMTSWPDMGCLGRDLLLNLVGRSLNMQIFWVSMHATWGRTRKSADSDMWGARD